MSDNFLKIHLICLPECMYIFLKISAYGHQCEICGKHNHFESVCHDKDLYDNNRKNCIKCGQFHNYEECPAFGLKCAKCYKFGHYKSQCENLCSFCGKLVHNLKDCPAIGNKCGNCLKLGTNLLYAKYHDFLKSPPFLIFSILSNYCIKVCNYLLFFTNIMKYWKSKKFF